MDVDTYEQIKARCNTAVQKQLQPCDVFDDEYLNEIGATWDTVMSVFSQVLLKNHKASFKKHKNRRKHYVNKYDNGQSILEIAAAANFSSFNIARFILAEKLGADNKELKHMTRDLSLIKDERLRLEVQRCIEHDTNFSPHLDRLKQNIGDDCEAFLEMQLRKHGIPFQSEADLRERGMPKTPDVLLTVPIGVKDTEGKLRFVFWIDSKGMFGDDFTHEHKNNDQLNAYVNRYGPGMVIYWAGFKKNLVHDDVLLVSSFPSDFVALHVENDA